MTGLDTYLPPWLRSLLPQDDPLVTLALALLAVFLWLRILMLLAGLFRRRPHLSAVPPPLPDRAPPSPPRGIAPPPVPGSARRSTRDCIWRQDLFRNTRTNTRWTCSTCGVEAYTQDGRPPKECKRDLGPAPL